MNGANTLPGPSASRVAAAEATALSQPALQLDAYSDILTDTACIDSSLPVLGGVDVVAYFSLEKGSSAVKGDSRISCLYQGFTFYFSKRSNKALFEASPAKYAPKWGNFCAYGIAYEQATWGNPSNRLGPPFDPDAWHIASDGRLYIFKEIKVVSHFTANETRAIARGNAFWQRVTGDCAACFNTLCSCDNGPDLSLCTCPPHGEACGNRHVPNSASSATA